MMRAHFLLSIAVVLAIPSPAFCQNYFLATNNVIQAADGNYYTVLNNEVYQITQQGTVRVIASNDTVAGSLVQGGDGAVYSAPLPLKPLRPLPMAICTV